jgi:EAL domain-containing protein (putative c-di-GMP-specific phosphodiesterase class I)
MLVAEGVETEAELQTIGRLGVPLVQGFYLSRPGPPWPLTNGAGPAVDIAPLGAPAAEAASVGVLAPVA